MPTFAPTQAPQIWARQYNWEVRVAKARKRWGLVIGPMVRPLINVADGEPNSRSATVKFPLAYCCGSCRPIRQYRYVDYSVNI
jgi:hypothetical protein